MPRLGHYLPLLKSVFFLYETVEDAKAGKNSGGTGFFVALASEVPTRSYIYAVTNWHVACGGAPVVRVNSKNGEPVIFDYGPDEWTFEPGGPDLAIIGVVIDTSHDVTPIGIGMAYTQPEKTSLGPFDVGDDVFMIGRFIDYDGAETNKPALRFGNISIVDATIKQETGYSGPSIVLDMHSRTGFSGSPVFGYRTSGSHFGKGGGGGVLRGDEEIFLGHTMVLLGVHFGQFPELWEIEAGSASAKENSSLLTDGKYVKGLSGMTTVIPASELYKLLFREDLVEMRKKNDERLKQSHEVRTEVVSERATAKDSAENPTHKEDFMRLLGEAAKEKTQAGQT